MQEAKTKIPSIILNIYIEYGEQDDDSLGGFSELNLNLDDSRRDISVSCRYCIIEGEKFLSTLHDQHIQNKDLQITYIAIFMPKHILLLIKKIKILFLKVLIRDKLRTHLY